MDASRFDTLSQRLARALSRRTLVGGSVSAALLGPLGLGEDGVAKKGKRVTSERCLAIGERCPKTLKHGKKTVKHTCEKSCCTRFSAVTLGGKRRCACVPPGESCTSGTARHCCTQTCGADGRCTGVQAPPQQTTCTGLDQACTTDAQCCTGICNVAGSTTGPRADTANKCETCRSGRAPCESGNGQCCGTRTCIDAAMATGASGFVCTSLRDEQCSPPAGATPTAQGQGTCESGADICRVTSTAADPGICCGRSGALVPGGICSGGTNAACCTGSCVERSANRFCCAPIGEDPAASGGTACARASGAINPTCCSRRCSATAGATVCGP
jgi:hypothetical protein